MDLRSDPDMIQVGGYRYVQNMVTDEDGKTRRLRGWRRAFSDRDANNWDLHDQLSADPSDPAAIAYTRQPITLLYEAVTPGNFSKLFAATQNRIYAQNNESGNWQVISDQYGGDHVSGCPERRWRAAHVESTVIFSNGQDPILSHNIDQPAESNGQFVSEIDDLNELYITKAKVVIAWNNMILLMNIEQDGAFHPNRIYWSDFKRPVSYLPSDESLASYQDLDDKDVILGAMPMKNVLLIYTTRGIWEMQVVGGEAVYSAAQRWTSEKAGKRTLAHPNTLVSTGEQHYYFGYDGIYRYSMFDQEPVLVDWLHRGSKRIFSTIEKSKCQVHVGGYEGGKNLIWWSWVKSGETCASESFIANVNMPFTAYVDHGFSAFLHNEPDTNKTIRTWMLEQCICTEEELEEEGFGWVKEGGYCSAPTYESCDTTPTVFYSHSGFTDGDVEVEDYNGSAAADSLYTILGDTTVNEFCETEYTEDDCNSERVFLAASLTDYCLKEMADIYYREVCVDFTAGGCGAYSRVGYRSRLLSGALDLKFPDDDKIVNRFAIEQHSQAETIPAQISLVVGAASHAVDPMEDGGNCVIIWDTQDDKELACLSAVSATVHEQDGTRPNDELEWGLYHKGRYLYFDLTIKNDDTDPVDMGGVVSFSRFTFDATPQMRC